MRNKTEMVRNKTEMVRKDFYLTSRQIDIIEKEADKVGITFSEILRRILDDYIETRCSE